jgi:hypothetical protein
MTTVAVPPSVLGEIEDLPTPIVARIRSWSNVSDSGRTSAASNTSRVVLLANTVCALEITAFNSASNKSASASALNG